MNEGEILVAIAHLEESLKSAHKRIDEIKELTDSVYKLATSIESMQKDINEDRKRIEKIEQKPALPPCQHVKDFERYDNKFSELTEEMSEIKEKPLKRWDKFVTGIITSLAGGIVGYILAVILK